MNQLHRYYMRMKLSLIPLLLLSCISNVHDTFNSIVLESSKGEKLYINSLNWGATDDTQITTITSDKEKLRKRTDTIDIVRGVEPFIYSFRDDTLELFFENEVTHFFNENLKTIHLHYTTLRTSDYNKMKAIIEQFL